MKTLTVLMAINKKFQDVELAKKHLDNECSKIAFLDPKPVLVTDVQSHEDYSRFCLERINSHVDTDFVLILQLDSFIANASAWTDDFFEYDYIGAPWKMEGNWRFKWWTRHGRDPSNKDLYVGNGGFTLRSKKLIDYVSSICRYSGRNEDTVICLGLRNRIEQQGMKFAPYEVAKVFSVEYDEYNGQFGVHKMMFENGKHIKVGELIETRLKGL